MPVTHYTWDPLSDNLLMESDENGQTTAVYTNEPDPYGQLISQRSNGATNYYHFDGQGSTRQLTDANQNVTDPATYTAFGEEVNSSGDTTNPFGFKGAVGYYANPETNDLYVRARTYEPVIGRWLSRDPIGYTDDVNRYRYAQNGPTRFFDPSGLAAYDCYCNCLTIVGEELYETRKVIYEGVIHANTRNQAISRCNARCRARNWRNAGGSHTCTGETSTARPPKFPEYDPESPGTVEEGTQVTITLDSILRPTTFCGWVRPTKMVGCRENITWHESVRFACLAHQFLIGDSLCNHIQDRIDEVINDPGIGYPFDCPGELECCLQKRYNGTYPVSLSVTRMRVSPGCSVTAAVSATITVEGQVGVCKNIR